MTALTTATGDDEEILELEPVPEKAPWWTPKTARTAFLSLAALAVLALSVAILAIALAPASAVTLLVVALVTLAVVVVAEIVLLLVAKPKQA